MSHLPPPSGPGPAPTAARQATLREFAAVIFRRKGIILGLFSVVVITVLALALTTPTNYESSGRVLVFRGEQSSQLIPNMQLFNDWEADLASEQATARSQPVIEEARDLLQQRAQAAHTTPLQLNEKNVDVQVIGKSNVLGIGYIDLDPKVARQVCDAVIAAYLDYRQNASTRHPQKYFAAQLDSLQRMIEQRLAVRAQVASRAGMTDPMDESHGLTGEMAYLGQERNSTAADLSEAQSSLHAMQELQKRPDVDIPTMPNPLPNESALDLIKQRIIDQQTRIATLRERYRDDSPEIQEAMQTLATLQALLRTEVDTRVSLLQARVDMLRARLETQDRGIGDVRRQLAQLPQDARTLDDMDAEIKVLRDRYADYVKARDAVAINANTTNAIAVTLLNPAGPAVPQNARDYVRLGLAPAFSLVVGIGLAFFIDGLDITVRTAPQAEEYLELPVLASLSERRRRR